MRTVVVMNSKARTFPSEELLFIPLYLVTSLPYDVLTIRLIYYSFINMAETVPFFMASSGSKFTFVRLDAAGINDML